ncbi:MAG TPA: hypothetical protein VLS27_07790, partial [Gammaproteobacteria bacterium]|nr:hypothetical protein [Gammaproteobacteria bacterium]
MSSTPSTAFDAPAVGEAPPGGNTAARLPDCVDSRWLLERMLSRAAAGLILFAGDVCVYASEGARSALGLRAAALEERALESFFAASERPPFPAG